MNAIDDRNRKQVEARLLVRSVRVGSCRVWLGKLNRYGYGRMWVDGIRPFYVHRLAYELWVGPITEESIDHLCGNRACIEPSHLDQCSLRENTLRGLDKRRPTHCPQGHEYSLENTYHSPTMRSKYCRTCHRSEEAVRRKRKVGSS